MSAFQAFSGLRTIAFLFLGLIFSLNGCNDVSTAPAPPVPLSPDALLTKLTVTPGTLQPTFSSDVASYAVSVDFNVSSVTVTATPQNTSATMTINGQATQSNQARTVTLGGVGSSTSIPIVVTAANGSQNTYIVTVQRAVNNSLQSLTVSPGTLAPVFDSTHTQYTVEVANNVANVNVTATLQDTTATMTINSQATNSGQARTITLGPAGTNTLITILVTAQNGNQKTYTVTVTRQALGGNNNLQSLAVSPGTLTPAFNAGTTNYTVNVASTVTTATVTATLQDTNASMEINAQGTSSGQARNITLGPAGTNTLITILVTAPNGTQKTYIVTVVRTALGGNNNLQGLTVSPGTLAPAFSAGTTSYTVNVDSSVATVSVTATLQDTSATMEVNGQGTSSGQARSITLQPAGSNTTITIIVTAPNGNQKTYIVTVLRAALGGNNNLQGLTVSPGTLAPAFSAGTTNYTVNVASSVASVTVTATLQDTNATMEINSQGTTSGQARVITLGAAGTNTPITIVITAPNGDQKTYSVTVVRAAIVLSGNNNLSHLEASAGPLVPGFDSTITIYAIIVPNATTDTTITATVEQSAATLTINGSAASSGTPSSSLALSEGLNAIPIIVTAENGTPRTYTVNITRLP